MTDAPLEQWTPAAELLWLSQWIDEHPDNAARSTEAQAWGRIAKITEEAGEVVAAMIGWTGQNPRKGVTHSGADVEAELLDVAITALGAVAHIRQNVEGLDVLALLTAKIHTVTMRARLSATVQLAAEQQGQPCPACGRRCTPTRAPASAGSAGAPPITLRKA